MWKVVLIFNVALNRVVKKTYNDYLHSNDVGNGGEIFQIVSLWKVFSKQHEASLNTRLYWWIISLVFGGNMAPQALDIEAIMACVCLNFYRASLWTDFRWENDIGLQAVLRKTLFGRRVNLCLDQYLNSEFSAIPTILIKSSLKTLIKKNNKPTAPQLGRFVFNFNCHLFNLLMLPPNVTTWTPFTANVDSAANCKQTISALKYCQYGPKSVIY